MEESIQLNAYNQKYIMSVNLGVEIYSMWFIVCVFDKVHHHASVC